MSAPKRIQRLRTKGWRMPDGAVYVGRPTKWGNPFRVVRRDGSHPWVVMSSWRDHILGAHETKDDAVAQSIEVYRIQVGGTVPDEDTIRTELAGRDLACWCATYEPCHADVLLEIANGGEVS